MLHLRQYPCQCAVLKDNFWEKKRGCVLPYDSELGDGARCFGSGRYTSDC